MNVVAQLGHVGKLANGSQAVIVLLVPLLVSVLVAAALLMRRIPAAMTIAWTTTVALCGLTALAWSSCRRPSLLPAPRLRRGTMSRWPHGASTPSSAHPRIPAPPQLSWNNGDGVAAYSATADADRSTAVAYSLLDLVQPATDEGADYYEHWVLSHFLLDGHHKIEAAASAGRPIRLLCLVDERISMTDVG